MSNKILLYIDLGAILQGAVLVISASCRCVGI